MRRVREHAGQRWLVLNAGVSARLRILIGAALGAHRAPSQQTAAGDRGAATASRPGDPDPSANPRVGSDSGADGISLPAAVIQALTEQHGPGNGSRVHVLDQSALKTLAKRHGLGVYTLRERLLTDPRFHEDAHRRLAVTL